MTEIFCCQQLANPIDPNMTISTGTSLKPLSKEETDLLESLGLLELNEGNKLEQQPSPINTTTSGACDNHSSVSITEVNSQAGGIWMKLNNITRIPKLRPDELSSVVPTVIQNPICNSHTSEHLPQVSIPVDTNNYSDESANKSQTNKIMLGIGGTLFLLPHLAVLLSLPPVLQRRGAPYLPTFRSKLNEMFDLIRAQIHNPVPNHNLTFVDLGSGDGRVVFRAAREGLFHTSVGFEINPTLHLFAQARKMITPKYWYNTKFGCGDLWKIELGNYDVIAVYGLAPIMDRLGAKMKKELKPGSIVVSNVFKIPGWKPIPSHKSEGVHLYRVPECFGSKKDEQ
jgi:hypothetical protein